MTAIAGFQRNMDEAEWRAREELAAACRIADRHDMIEGAANHFSLMVPGTADRFLLNPRGMYFSEVTASKLLVVDVAGNRISGEGDVRPVAFRLHGHFHRASAKATCVLHCHPFYGTTIAMVNGARLGMYNYTSKRWYSRIAYDDHPEGHVTDGECERCARLLGDASIMVHAAHGITVIGPTVADAIDELYFFERQCRQQVLAATYAAAAGLELHSLPEDMCRSYRYSDGQEPSNQRAHFEAMIRLLDKEEPDYKT